MYKASAKWQRDRDQVRNAAVVGKENVLPASSWPSSRACRHTGTKAHYLFYPHSVIRRLTTSHLKRVISKMPRRPGGTVYECKIVSTPLRKNKTKQKSPESAGTKATSPALHPEQPGIQTDRPNAWQQK